MSQPNDAQQRADDIQAFRRELARLAAEGALRLAAEEAQALREHHERCLEDLAGRFAIDRDGREKKLSQGMRVASFLGALALAASVFFFVHQLWSGLGSVARIAILVGASLASLLLTHVLHQRDRAGHFTKLAALVAFACFVMNIALLGRLFNFVSSDAALLLWMAYALVLAYGYGLRLLLGVAILCFTAYVAARAGTIGGLYWLDLGERPENFFPAAALLLVLAWRLPQSAFPGFARLYRVFGLLCLFLPTLVLANWGQASYLILDADFIEGAYQVLGFAAAALAIAAGLRWQLGDVSNTGLVFFVIFLYTKFFDWWWALLPKSLFFLILGLTALLFLFILRRLHGRMGARA